MTSSTFAIALVVVLFSAYFASFVYDYYRSKQKPKVIEQFKGILDKLRDQPNDQRLVNSAIRLGVEFHRSHTGKQLYQLSLELLKSQPTSAEIKELTLKLGRLYSNSCRDKRGVTIFDEMVLSNDLAAATASATVGKYDVGKVEVTNAHELGGDGVAAEIEKLGKLFLKGTITSEEFEKGKELFLGTSPNKAVEAVKLVESLHSLFVGGAITEAEFNMKKWDILSEKLLPKK